MKPIEGWKRWLQCVRTENKMAKRPPNGEQLDAITPFAPLVQESFDLQRQDVFVTSLGVDFTHYKAMPSPIGQKDRGDYRRNDGVDTITSNGMIYTCAGKFTGTITDNSRKGARSDGGLLDPSESRLVLPRFYNLTGQADGPPMYFSVGDRLYISDPDADVFVVNYHKMDYEDGVDNIPMFPICRLDAPITDSRNTEYIQGVDFNLTSDGNIRWLSGGKNPGIDPETGKGRIYSVRYLYKAFWYVTTLLKEIRISNVTYGGVRAPERMPYYINITREYIFHNQNRGDINNQLKSKTPKRVDAEPIQSTNPNGKPIINVDMRDYEEADEE